MPDSEEISGGGPAGARTEPDRHKGGLQRAPRARMHRRKRTTEGTSQCCSRKGHAPMCSSVQSELEGGAASISLHRHFNRTALKAEPLYFSVGEWFKRPNDQAKCGQSEFRGSGYVEQHLRLELRVPV